MAGQHGVTRKLAAILYADVVGYSRLTGADEEGTHKTVSEYLDVIADMVSRQRGRVVHYAGDAVLAEFASVVSAVQCAIEIQKDLSDRNAVIPEGRKVQFRIGINLGDVIVDRDDIYGNGVNVAARLEGLAVPGGICVSASVFEQVHSKVDVDFQDMGPQAVKNIERPVQAYSVTSKTSPSPEPQSAVPDKPSIAVLPFDNLSGDPNENYFSDGISEDIITALARFPSLFVIARNSSFTYKGKPVDVKRVGQELGVRYVLEGSVRKSDNRVRITGQLVQADNGIHIWAERYDGDLTDVFALQDQMAASVVGAVVPSIHAAEIERARRKTLNNQDAYDLYLRALPEFYAQTQESTRLALSLVEQALALDPNFVSALLLGENCWSFLAMQGWVPTAEAQPEIMKYARRAVQIDNNDAEALATLARRLCAIDGDYEGAFSLAEKATTLNPNSATAQRQSGYAFLYSGHPERALQRFNMALRLSPRDPRAEDCWTGVSQALMQLSQDAEAVAAGRKAVQANPHSTSAWRVFTASLALNGQIAEARAAAETLISIDPSCSLTTMLKRIAYTEKASARYFEGLRQAGVSE